MKRIIKQGILALLFMLAQNSMQAQSKNMKTDTLTIFGNCGQCKTRIQDAAYIKGVKQANWDKKTKILTLIYNTQKTNMAAIETSIAKAGHDSYHTKASVKNYNKLPGCCAYRTGTCNHE
jgi:periplasmic mercuric ion binding protein